MSLPSSDEPLRDQSSSRCHAGVFEGEDGPVWRGPWGKDPKLDFCSRQWYLGQLLAGKPGPQSSGHKENEFCQHRGELGASVSG